MTQRRPAAPPLQTFRILYAALFASTFVYLGLLLSGLISVVPAEDSTMALAMGMSGLCMVAASFLVPRLLHRSGLAALELEVEEVPDPDSSVMFREQTPTIRSFAKPERAESEARRVYFTPFILRLALNESISLFGFVLGMVGYGLPVVLPFFLVSWLLFLLSAPRASGWRDPVAVHFDARFLEP